MARPKRANDCGLPPHWKVRVVLPGTPLHFASLTEPVLRFEAGRLSGISWDLIVGTEHGDTPGYLDWPSVVAVSWRFAPLVEAEDAGYLKGHGFVQR
jgi:hypothetical protein